MKGSFSKKRPRDLSSGSSLPTAHHQTGQKAEPPSQSPLFLGAEEFRILAEAAPLGIAIVSKTGEYRYINPKFQEIFGYTLKDIPTGREWFAKAYPDPAYRQAVVADWKQEFAEPRPGEVSPRTFTVTCKDGTEKVINFRSAALATGDILIFYEDISQRLKAEEALRQSEEKYRLLVSQLPAVVFQGYPDWSLDCPDRKIEELTGYAKEDFDSRRLKWCDLIPPEELDYVKQTFVEALKSDHKSYVREHRIRKKNGEFAWVQCRGQIFLNDQGKVSHVSGVTFDITQRKRADEALRESERLYRLLAENVSDVIWTADLNKRLTYVSPSVKVLRGFTPEEVMSQSLEEIFTPASLELARQTFAEGMALESVQPDPGRTWTLEVEQYRKDGATVWTEIKASFLRDESGRPVGILGVTRDISKRKETELKLRRREAILKAVSSAAEKFLQSESWEKEIQSILSQLGQAAEVSRAYILENRLSPEGELRACSRYEWTTAESRSQRKNPEWQSLTWRAQGLERWAAELSQGRLIVGHLRDLPLREQELPASRNVKSLVVVPIFVGPHWWGSMGFDALEQEREWSEAELEALKAAANILGAAIQHEMGEQARRRTGEKLRFLAGELIKAQEKERKRLAAELHDELGHRLLALKLSIRSLERELSVQQTTLKKTVNRILQNIDETIEGIRRLYHDLSPGDLEDLGLTMALHNLVEDFKALNPKIKWVVKLDNLDGLFGVQEDTVIYRVVQEALTNIGKHARPTRVTVSARQENGALSLVIEDNGRGFDPAKVLEEKRSLGLLAMEERIRLLGGSFSLWSEKNKGTRISLSIPFPAPEG